MAMVIQVLNGQSTWAGEPHSAALWRFPSARRAHSSVVNRLFCTETHPTHHIWSSADQTHQNTAFKVALRGRPLQKLHLLFPYPCGPRNLHFLYWGTTPIKRIESYSYECTSREASEFEFLLGKERNWDVVSHILHLRSILSSCDPSWVVDNSTIRHTLKDKKWTKVLTDLGDRKKRKGSRVSKDSLIH